MEEVRDKYKNKTPRPVNAFVLYRKAHKSRIQKTEDTSNSRLISLTAGMSWVEEPTQVKKRYYELARVEARNPAAAFRTYKFKLKRCHVVDFCFLDGAYLTCGRPLLAKMHEELQC